MAIADSAEPAFRARMGLIFDDLGRLPLTGWRQTADELSALATGAYGAVLRVTQSYRFAGFDRTDTSVTRYLTVTRHRGGPWMIDSSAIAASAIDVDDDPPAHLARQ